MGARSLTIEQIFNKIEEQTSYVFAYSKSDFRKMGKVQLTSPDGTLKEILSQALKDTGFSYQIEGKHIIIVAKTTPDKPITQILNGTVIDDQTGKPIASAEVTIIGKSNLKTKTDDKGRFTIKNIPLGSQAVTITADGYKNRERGVELTTSKPADMQIMLKTEKLTEPDIIDEPLIQDTIPTPSANEIKQVAPEDTTHLQIIPTTTITLPKEKIKQGHPTLALKSNLLYWASSTPNLGAELYLAEKWTVEATLGYNPWYFQNNATLRHWLVQPELRYWPCRSFEGHFFGLHTIYSKYNVGKISFINDLKDYTYRGDMYGAGLSYGYHFPLKGKWGLELTAGLGYIHLDYDKYKCTSCLKLDGNNKRNYWGPTKAGISLIYLLE